MHILHCHLLSWDLQIVNKVQNLLQPALLHGLDGSFRRQRGMTSEKFWMCSVLVWMPIGVVTVWGQVLYMRFCLHKEDIEDIGGQLPVLANLKLDGLCCNYKWHSYLQWKCTFWDGAKNHHQDLRNTGWEGQRRGKCQKWQQCYQPKWCFFLKKVAVAAMKIFWFTRENELIFGLVKLKLVMKNQERYRMKGEIVV